MTLSLPKILSLAFLAGLVSLDAKTAEPKALFLHGGGEKAEVRLIGPDASQQLVVTSVLTDGGELDVTREVHFSAEPAGVVQIDKQGAMTPVANGKAIITARSLEGLTTTTGVQVVQVETPQAVNFPNEVVPLFTKYGCNGGGCHGKSEGQNGFRLSLLGFEPAEDYEYLVKEGRGRRLFPAAPEFSLLLQKGTGELPHGGGDRLKKGSPEYQTMVRWIEQGMPYGKKEDPVVERIEVFPKVRIMSPEGKQQLAVTAFYSDGSTEDVSRVVQYEANEKEMAEATNTGLVTVGTQTGDVGVMIRFQEFVDVFRATIPLGAPTGEFPKPGNFIDELVFKKLKTLGLPPSEVADDMTFFRRVAIDIAGRLPDPEETAAFMASEESDKRAKWIDTLLESEEYADHFASKWNAILRNKRAKGNYARGNYAFHSWVRQSVYENKPFDRFLTELLSASGDVGQNPPVAWYRAVKKREDQLQDMAQVFLGVRLQCAQCHHHPYERWSQQDYYGFAAFFSRVGRKTGLQPGEELVYHRRGKAEAKNPKTNQNVSPTPLGDPVLSLPPEEDPRRHLAAWMTAPENPFLARMLANRYWKHFFNRGLVEPEDDMRVTNPPTNPELLDALAAHFVESGFDMKALIRSICNSQTYQLSSLPNEYNADDKQNYSRYYPKRLTAEVMLDAIDDVTDVRTKFPGRPVGSRALQLPDDSFNGSSYFLTVFGRPETDSACECERTQAANLAQSLHLLNSKGIQEKLTNDQGRAAGFRKDEAREVEAKLRDLYLTAFSREPRPSELKFAIDYIEKKKNQPVTEPPAAEAKKGEKEGDEKGEEKKKADPEREAYEDILWAIINTKEFLFNH